MIIISKLVELLMVPEKSSDLSPFLNERKKYETDYTQKFS